jgi:hypothetical protein
VYGEALFSRWSSSVLSDTIPIVTVVGLGPVYDHARFNDVGAQLSLSEMIIPLLPFTATAGVHAHEPPILTVGLSFMLTGGF